MYDKKPKRIQFLVSLLGIISILRYSDPSI